MDHKMCNTKAVMDVVIVQQLFFFSSTDAIYIALGFRVVPIGISKRS